MELKDAISFVYNNLGKFAWEDFAKARLAFPNYASIANPLLERDSKEYLEMEQYFSHYFQVKRCHHGFILRIVNSAVIVVAKI